MIPTVPTNSGKTVCPLTPSAVQVHKSYSSADFEKTVVAFVKEVGSLEKAYNNSRASHRVPLKLPQGVTICFSSGKHNRLQVAVIEEFGPCYVTAFLRMRDFHRYAADIAWETEVWVADNPEHMIHFNGPNFLGPYTAVTSCS